MAAAAASRKSLSIHDYPEHLNPFYEDDNHNKIRFWTIGRKLNRSNSTSFLGLKDLKNSWALKSFMKKGKKNKPPPTTTTTTEKQTAATTNGKGETSPIIYRRAMQYSSIGPGGRTSLGSSDRYIYGGSVTPLPRSRFQERLRSPSHIEEELRRDGPIPPARMARSEISNSRLSVESTNPFDDGPVPPVRASRRKKKRAPAPPQNPDLTINEQLDNSADDTLPSKAAETTLSSTDSTITEKEINGNRMDTSTSKTSNDNNLNHSNSDHDIEMENVTFDIELKIVEDDDDVRKVDDGDKSNGNVIINEEAPSVKVAVLKTMETKDINKNNEHSDTESDNDVVFPKIDIGKYRRNSSIDESDIKLRRGNLEDFNVATNKRSKSLTFNTNNNYITYDINLSSDSVDHKDSNGNDKPQKVICKMFNVPPRKHSIESSNTEKEFNEIDKATKELEREINKLNSALNEDESFSNSVSVSEIKKKFDNADLNSPNPIPKPRRSYHSSSPTNVKQ